jgi:hypothetical protein
MQPTLGDEAAQGRRYAGIDNLDQLAMSDAVKRDDQTAARRSGPETPDRCCDARQALPCLPTDAAGGD